MRRYSHQAIKKSITDKIMCQLHFFLQIVITHSNEQLKANEISFLSNQNIWKQQQFRLVLSIKSNIVILDKQKMISNNQIHSNIARQPNEGDKANTNNQSNNIQEHIAATHQILQNSMDMIELQPQGSLNQKHHQQQQQNSYNQHIKVNNSIKQEAPPNKIVIIQGNQVVSVNNTQNVIIVNHNQKPVQDPIWNRESRIGCCCFSLHNQTCCFDYSCMSKLCRSIQGCNLCCYCPNMDCVYCFIHHACRTCCFQKGFCECMYQCCSRMPICMLFNCLKNCGCGELICGCGAKLCGCCCGLINNLGCICQVLKGCGCCKDIFCIVIDIVCCLCK